MKQADIQVTYKDHMGSDLTVVDAARVSFAKESAWELLDVTRGGQPSSVQTLKPADAKLIKYLAQHNHWSPFAHTSIQFRIKAPIFVARQLVKHQIGGVWNEVSRRYVDDEPEFYFPEVWRSRPDGSVKQGSGGAHENGKTWGNAAKEHLKNVAALYDGMIAAGVAPEQARMVLPQNVMTEWFWTGSLMFFARVCKQRLDPHAQAETRRVAELIAPECAKLFPVSWRELVG